MSTSIPRVLIVGAGATGSCAALRLKRSLGLNVAIEVWEKARGPGGRMSTNRCDAAGVNLRADMGAQYLSLDCSNPSCKEVSELLVSAGVCAEVPAAVLSSTDERNRGGDWQHLAGTSGGVNDALKKLLEEAGATPHYEKRVASIDEQQGKWRVRPYEGAPCVFDAVILAVPGCGVGGDNLNKIRGSYENNFSQEQNRQLLGVQHDARWAFAFYLPNDCAENCDVFFGDDTVEKVVDDNAVHLLCYQSRKTKNLNGTPQDAGVVVVAHSTVEWANRNARANGRDQRILSEMTEKVGQILKLKGSLARTMLGSKVITWKQCQVTKAAPKSQHGPCMRPSSGPTLALAGDYFTDSSFGGCLQSAFAAADVVVEALGTSATGTKQAQQRGLTNMSSGVEQSSDRGKGKKGNGKGNTNNTAKADDGYGSNAKGKGKSSKKGY